MPDGPSHKNQTGANLHVPGYQQSSDPGAVGAGKYWIDTTGGTGAWALKVRNAGDSGWETVATAGSGLTAASQAQEEAGTDITVGTTPGRQHYHPSAAKGWISFDGTGTIAVRASYNVTSITDNGAGDYTVTWDIDFSSAEYSAVGQGWSNNVGSFTFMAIKNDSAPAAGTTRIQMVQIGVGYVDSAYCMMAAFGDQ